MTRRGIAAWLTLALVAAGALYCGLACFVLHPGVVYSRRWCVDVVTGRRQYTLAVLGIRLVNRTSETRLSSLYTELIGKRPPPRWELMSAQVHRLRHGSYQEGGYDFAWGAGEKLAIALQQQGLFTRSAQKAAVSRYLDILQSDRPGLAPDYTEEVQALAEQWDATKGPIDVKDLP